MTSDGIYMTLSTQHKLLKRCLGRYKSYTGIRRLMKYVPQCRTGARQNLDAKTDEIISLMRR